jgi:hypothetical protein
MFRSSLLITSILILTNSLAGLILSSYSTFNMLLSNGSLLVSGILTAFVYHSTIHKSLKLGVTLLFSLTGGVRFLTSLFSPERLEDNYALVIMLVILATELICLVVVRYLDQKKRQFFNEHP